MANLTKSNKITVGGGLHSRIASKQMLGEVQAKVDAKTLPNRLAIVADFSGSMGSPADYRDTSAKTKLQLLGDAVQDFAMRSDPQTTAIAVESFPRGFRIELTNDKNEVWMRMFNLSTIGDTPMGEGLAEALAHHSPTRAMLISDGEQTDGDACFTQAEIYKQREIIIDCVHIGDSSRGEDTLRRIAQITGGLYIKFRDVSSFSENFHYLLPGEREAIAGMLPYEAEKLLGANEVK